MNTRISVVSLLVLFSTGFSWGQSVQLGRMQDVSAYDQYGRPNPDAFDWTGLSLGINGGTLGYGADITYSLASWANIRGSFHVFSLTYKDTISGVDTTFDFDFTGLITTIDLYPGTMRGFRIALGAGLNSHEVPLSGGSIKGKAEYDTFAPYAGLGWGNPVQPDSALTFTFDLGFLLQDYSLSVDESVSADAKSDIEEILDYATIYPVITFGLHYHF